jgi:hypothetical protein
VSLLVFSRVACLLTGFVQYRAHVVSGQLQRTTFMTQAANQKSQETQRATPRTIKAVRKAPTQKARLIAALSKTKPPTITRLAATLSLQPHSVRAAISGLRKAGHQIETIKSPTGGPATYRHVADVATHADRAVG